MRKRLRKKKGISSSSAPSPAGPLRPRRQALKELPALFDQADALIEQGKAREAVELLEPLLEVYPREADLHYYIGYARVEAGLLWEGLYGYERARELSGEPQYWGMLTSLYMAVGLPIHAHRALRQAIKHLDVFPLPGNPKELLAAMDRDLAAKAQELGIDVKKAEEGFYLVECGRRAMARQDYETCIQVNRQAIRLLGDWPPPHNNLSQALFATGRQAEAIAEARAVLSHDPENIHALGNIIRFLAWTDREKEARRFWQKMKTLPILDTDWRYKLVESAAILGDDDFIYRTLRPIARQGSPAITERERIFLAIAEANTGRRRDAQRRLEALHSDWVWVNGIVRALQAGQPGPGFSARFPYFASAEIVPVQELKNLVELLDRQEEMSEQEFDNAIEAFTARFPQIVQVAEKFIMEEGQPGAGIAILSAIGTPEAYAVLRRFALSQHGDDQLRLDALSRLGEAGEITEDEPLQMWLEGKWREVYLKMQEVTEEEESYQPAVVELLNQGIHAFHEGNYESAERLFRRALELDPRIKQAYNNLGTIYARRDEHEQAKEMYRKALEIDPYYPVPRCNLALYLLSNNDVAGADAMIAPLRKVIPNQPQDIALYSYVQARILLARQEYDDARTALQSALRVFPDHRPSQELLKRLDEQMPLLKAFQSFAAQQRERRRVRRIKMQSKITRPDPSLPEALVIYSKEALVGIARAIYLGGSWTALRKAELVGRIADALADEDTLAVIVSRLHDEDRAALRAVSDHGGAMAWQVFADQYGDDMEESGYWQWHPPETVMGRLRQHGLLVEATVSGQRLIVIPAELRLALRKLLA